MGSSAGTLDEALRVVSAVERAGRVRTGRFGRSRTAPALSFSKVFRFE